jgi:hypothetical protein
MSDTIIKPLSAWPPTVEFTTPDGLPAYRVSAHVLTPERARAADGCAELLRAALFLGCACVLWLVFSPAHFALQLTVALAVFFTGNALVLRYIAGLFRETTLIELTIEQVGVRWRKACFRFPRHGHRFKHQVHDRAVGEQRDNEVARQAASIDREVTRGSYYYADSFHIIFDLGGHRYDLLTIYGPQEAAAVLARLQYLDRQLDAAVKMGKGVPEQPRDEWAEAPGDVA